MMLRLPPVAVAAFLLMFCCFYSTSLLAEDERFDFDQPLGDTLLFELPFEGEVTVCFDTTLLGGAVISFDTLTCGGPLNSGEVFLDPINYCLTYISGTAPGLDVICLVACSDVQCDTSEYTFAVTNTGPTANTDNFTVNQNETTPLNVLENDDFIGEISVSILAEPSNGSVVVNENGTISYTPTADYCGLDQFTYEVCSNVELCSSADVVLNVGVDCPDASLTFYDSFSPNGDSFNDFFVIDGLDNFPSNVLRIFNRQGSQVFEQRNYDNTWDGTWNGGALPDGTYFYYFEDGLGNISSGYVLIYR
ncbi:MAG: gliding motility-associated C-terminal domain-containing protein [Bacteroidota bacterium]